LEARRNPYWQGIGGGRGGVSLGYRKSAGTGVWIGKLVFEGKRTEEKIAQADDDGAPAGALPFRAAVTATMDWATRKHAEIDDAGAKRDSSAPTVESAIAEYVVLRTAKSAREGANAAGRLKKHVLSNTKFSKTPLAKLREHHFDSWRQGVPITGHADDFEDAEVERISPSTFNRLVGDLRAALNRAAERYRRELPAQLVGEIRVGTKALPLEETARKQILSDAQVAAAIKAAQDPEIDPDGDFGRLVLVLAATGARFGQASALDVADLQIHAKRLMVGGAKKGRRATTKPPAAVPLSDGVIDALRPIVADRGPAEPLLERWAFKRGVGLGWARDKRQRWSAPKQMESLWAMTVERAELPEGTVPYALRHSSIVRGLRAGVPIRIVAAQHDTSVEMIESHYGRYISEATEDIARRASLSL
jgi:integrase